MSTGTVAADAVSRASLAAARHLGVRPADVSLELLDARRSVRPVFRATAEGRDLIVKQYLDAEFLAGAADRLASLAAVRERVTAPELLGVDREGLLLLMTFVPGTPLVERLRSTGVDAKHAAARAGSAVAMLHGCDLELPERMSRREMLDKSARMVAKYERASREHALATGDRAAATALELDAGRTRAGLARAERLVIDVPDEPLVPTHGDLGPGQLLDGGIRPAILDFDRAVTAEAARDLGYFVAHLLRDLPDRADELASSFIDGYANERPLPSRRLIDAYTIVVLLRKLARATRPPSMLPTWAAESARERARAVARLRPAIDRLLESE